MSTALFTLGHRSGKATPCQSTIVGSVLASAEEAHHSIGNSRPALKLLSLPAAQQEAELLMGDPFLAFMRNGCFSREKVGSMVAKPRG